MGLVLHGRDMWHWRVSALPSPHPYCTSVHILPRNLWPLILHPTPHNFSSPLCWSIKVGCAWAWVAGAAFLTFRFSRSDLVTFGRKASVVPPPPSPPTAERAIMPSMSNHFSIKMQTSTSLSFSIDKYCPVEEQTASSGGAWQEQKQMVVVTKGSRLTFYSK